MAGPLPPQNPTISNNSTTNKLSFYFEDSATETGQQGQVYNVRYGTSSSLTGNGEQVALGKNKSSYNGTFPTGNLSSDTTYYAEFNFADGQEVSSWVAAASSATTDGAVPDAPGTSPTATSVDFETIALSWSAVSNATSYKLYWAPGEGNPTSNETTISSGTTYTVGFLDEAQSYSFRLKAGNSSGYSGYGPTLTQSTIYEDEGTISLSNNTATANTISWSVPTSDAGGDESKLYGEINDTTPDVLISTQSGTGAKNYTHTGLTPGGTYSYRLRIYLANNNGFYSTNQVSTVTNPGEVPDAPSIPTVSAKTTSAITFTWSSVSNATSYKLYFGTNNPPTNIDNGSSQSGTTKQYTGLSTATTYRFRIIATNSSGDSGYSGTQTTDTITSAGGQPSTPTSVTPVSQTISWTNPSGTSHAYLYGGTSSNSTTQLASGAGLTSYSHVSLTPGTTYYYRTRTKTTNHDNFYSAYGSNRSGATVTVDVPTSFGYTATSTSQITYNWTNPTFSDRTYFYIPSTLYQITVPDYVTGTTRLIGDGDEDATAPIYLSQNISYSLKARNYYSGHYSSYTSTFTGYTFPGNPTSLSTTADDDTKITVTWTGPAGSGLTETFYVEWGETTSYSTGNHTTSANATSYQITGLDQSTNYDIRVKTITAAGTTSGATTDRTTASGPDPELGDTLEMKYLGVMTGDAAQAAEISLGEANDDATTEISFRDFFAGAMSSIGGNTDMSENSTQVLTANFDNAGTAFNAQIAAGNFSWTRSNSNLVLLGSSGRTQTVRADGYPNTACVITCTFTPSFNDHMTTVIKQRTIYITY